MKKTKNSYKKSGVNIETAEINLQNILENTPNKLLKKN